MFVPRRKKASELIDKLIDEYVLFPYTYSIDFVFRIPLKKRKKNKEKSIANNSRNRPMKISLAAERNILTCGEYTNVRTKLASSRMCALVHLTDTDSVSVSLLSYTYERVNSELFQTDWYTYKRESHL